AVVVRFVLVSLDARERAGMRLDGKQQVKSVSQQQRAGDSEVEQFFLPYRTFRCEVAAERAWHSEAGRRQQHHRAVYACGSRIVLRVPGGDTAEKECDAQGQK